MKEMSSLIVLSAPSVNVIDISQIWEKKMVGAKTNAIHGEKNVHQQLCREDKP